MVANSNFRNQIFKLKTQKTKKSKRQKTKDKISFPPRVLWVLALTNLIVHTTTNTQREQFKESSLKLITSVE